MGVKRAVEIAQAQSEGIRDRPLPEEERGERHGWSVVQSVQLPVEEYTEIERIAAQDGVPVEALIRGWVLAGLAAKHRTSRSGA